MRKLALVEPITWRSALLLAVTVLPALWVTDAIIDGDGLLATLASVIIAVVVGTALRIVIELAIGTAKSRRP